jgi:hypothetical protein
MNFLDSHFFNDNRTKFFLIVIVLVLHSFCNNLIAQIKFVAKDPQTLSYPLIYDAEAYIKGLDFKDIKNQSIPSVDLYTKNPSIFPEVINTKEFNIFLNSFYFNERSAKSKRNLIKQGLTYFIEKKIMIEIVQFYLNPSLNKFDLDRFESEFLKQKLINSQYYKEHLHFLISFAEIFENWDSYNYYILPPEFAKLPENELIALRTLVNQYLSIMIKKEFYIYDYVNTSNKVAKSLYLDHGNDIFTLPIQENRDRDMTGSFRVELATDLLKMRFFNRLNRSDILSYQSIFFGGEGYTPYIRYNPALFLTKKNIEDGKLTLAGNEIPLFSNNNTNYSNLFLNNFLAPVSNLFQKSIDRPFASYQYIGRAKYRIPIHGLWRYMGEFKFGFIGKSLGQDIQAAIHKDLNPSIKVLNWDNQIGYPGRLALDMHFKFDGLLFSQNRQVIKEKFNFRTNNETYVKNRNWVNTYFLSELNVGTVQNALTLGLGITNKTFKKQSGQKEVRFDSRLLNNFFISYESKLKWVQYNSLLRGLGLFSSFNNATHSGVNPDNYVLGKEDFKPFIWINDLKLTYRLRRVGFTYSTFISTQEFKKSTFEKSGKTEIEYLDSVLNDPKLGFTNSQIAFGKLLLNTDDISSKLNIPKLQYYGTVGLNFYIE